MAIRSHSSVLYVRVYCTNAYKRYSSYIKIHDTFQQYLKCEKCVLVFWSCFAKKINVCKLLLENTGKPTFSFHSSFNSSARASVTRFSTSFLNQKLNLGPIQSKTVSRIFRFRKDIREIRCRHSRRLHGHGVGV